jgi:hypothetical protein
LEEDEERTGGQDLRLQKTARRRQRPVARTSRVEPRLQVQGLFFFMYTICIDCILKCKTAVASALRKLFVGKISVALALGNILLAKQL